MKSILKTCGIAASWLVIGGLLAVCVTSVSANDVETAGRSIEEFINPDGRFDIEAARQAGFEGSLDLDGFDVQFDPRTGEPLFSTAAGVNSPSDHPDDIYWDNSISPSVPGAGGSVCDATVYDGQLIVGGGSLSRVKSLSII